MGGACIKLWVLHLCKRADRITVDSQYWSVSRFSRWLARVDLLTHVEAD